MKFLSLLSLFSLTSAYEMETIHTTCFWIDDGCHNSHANKLLSAINKKDYISHSTTSTDFGFHSIIIYK